MLAEKQKFGKLEVSWPSIFACLFKAETIRPPACKPDEWGMPSP
jgi:hypothetical protein